MGCYINPAAESKESWLEEHGTELDKEPDWISIPPECLPVCLVDNGEFTAAAVGYNEEETLDFRWTERDPRPRRWFTAPIAGLLTVSDLEKWQCDD